MNIKDLIEAVKFQVSVKPHDEFMREVAEGLEKLYVENNYQKAEIELYRKDQGKLIIERDGLKAEIERLKDYPKCVYEYDGDITDYCLKSPCSNYKTADEIKSEAVKEFADRLKEEIINKPSAFRATQATVDFLNGLAHRQHEILNDIDNLVKEMVGEG